MKAIAKGSQQKVWFSNLLTEEGQVNPCSELHGKAKQWGDRYFRSFRNLLERMKSEGYRIRRVPGIRGGEYTATYYAEKEGV